jgi:hypothetical protein
MARKVATSNTTPSGAPQGTMGGRAIPAADGLLTSAVGEVGYLWALVGLEVMAMVGFRKHFRRYHGG